MAFKMVNLLLRVIHLGVRMLPQTFTKNKPDNRTQVVNRMVNFYIVQYTTTDNKIYIPCKQNGKLGSENEATCKQNNTLQLE